MATAVFTTPTPATAYHPTAAAATKGPVGCPGASGWVVALVVAAAVVGLIILGLALWWISKQQSCGSDADCAHVCAGARSPCAAVCQNGRCIAATTTCIGANQAWRPQKMRCIDTTRETCGPFGVGAGSNGNCYLLQR